MCKEIDKVKVIEGCFVFPFVAGAILASHSLICRTMAVSGSVNSSSIQVAKKQLRNEIKETLSRLSEEEKITQSNCLTNKLLRHEKFIAASRIGVYLSLPDEVHTHHILREIFHRGISCFIPRYDSKHMKMVQLYSLQEIDSLPKTKWNIPQPDDDNERIRMEAIQSGAGLDVMLVPGRAFTQDGHRLGRGKGYYDKYLNLYSEKFEGKLPYLIGLAFSQQMRRQLPVTDEDVTLNEVLFHYT